GLEDVLAYRFTVRREDQLHGKLRQRPERLRQTRSRLALRQPALRADAERPALAAEERVAGDQRLRARQPEHDLLAAARLERDDAGRRATHVVELAVVLETELPGRTTRSPELHTRLPGVALDDLGRVPLVPVNGHEHVERTGPRAHLAIERAQETARLG